MSHYRKRQKFDWTVVSQIAGLREKISEFIVQQIINNRNISKFLWFSKCIKLLSFMVTMSDFCK